jgi:hypothetical protein
MSRTFRTAGFLAGIGHPGQGVQDRAFRTVVAMAKLGQAGQRRVEVRLLETFGHLPVHLCHLQALFCTLGVEVDQPLAMHIESDVSLSV